MARKLRSIKPVYPVNFHADPEIYSEFLTTADERSKHQKDALNEAMYIWIHLGNDKETLDKLKRIREAKQQAGVGGE